MRKLISPVSRTGLITMTLPPRGGHASNWSSNAGDCWPDSHRSQRPYRPFQIIQNDRRRAAADAALQTDAAGLVAVVTAVVDVVGPVDPREQLQQEPASLLLRPLKYQNVSSAGSRRNFADNRSEGFFPSDDLVVRLALAIAERMDQPPE
jgi:hypothetical protein